MHRWCVFPCVIIIFERGKWNENKLWPLMNDFVDFLFCSNEALLKKYITFYVCYYVAYMFLLCTLGCTNLKLIKFFTLLNLVDMDDYSHSCIPKMRSVWRNFFQGETWRLPLLVDWKWFWPKNKNAYDISSDLPLIFLSVYLFQRVNFTARQLAMRRSSPVFLLEDDYLNVLQTGTY